MRWPMVLLLISFALIGSAQKTAVFMMHAGTNIVDVEKSTEIPLYENRSLGGSYLEDWNTFHYMVGVKLYFEQSEELLLGGEITFNQLYYWEEAYDGGGLYPYYRYGDVTTVGLGGVLKYYMVDNIYLQPGLGFHFFNDDSGITLGTTIAAGYEMELSSGWVIPIELRTNQIFGNALSFTIGLGAGIIRTF